MGALVHEGPRLEGRPPDGGAAEDPVRPPVQSLLRWIMGIYVDIIANETTARTTETQMLAGNTATAGKYYPKFKGKLVKVRIKVTPQAATSLCQAGYVKLIQEDWDPNTIIFAFNGFGLATAPQVYGGNQDRKSTRLNSSHVEISYAVFCLKKKNSEMW